MKVLQVNNYHYPRGGADRYFLDITRLLRQYGYEVGTFASAHEENVDTQWLVVPPPQGVRTGGAQSIGNVARFLYSSEARKRMEQAIDVFKPDIAHVHIYYGQLTASILDPLRRAAVPVIQTLHEYKLVCPTHGLYANGAFCDACKGRHYWKAVSRACNRGSRVRSALSAAEAYLSEFLGARKKVDSFIAVSDFQKNQLERLGVAGHRLKRLYHFASNGPAPKDDPGSYFLYAGRVNRDKGIGVALEAIAVAGRRDLILKVAGTGEDIGSWQAYAESLGIADKVQWVGFKSGAELDDLYDRSRAVINPSMLTETFGLTCLEALGRGRPVIASRVGAFPEVVTDNVDGLLFEAGDSAALAQAMARLLDNPQLVLQMGQQGWEKVIREFSATSHRQKLVQIYESVLGD